MAKEAVRWIRRQATPQEGLLCVDILVAAFAEDPFLGWLLAEVEDPDEGRFQLFSLLVEHGFDHGLVEILVLPSEGIGGIEPEEIVIGVALWFLPGAWPPPFGALAQEGQLLLSLTGLFPFLRKLRYLSAIQKRHPKALHSYLSSFAIDPAYQGQGWGRRFLGGSMEEAAKRGEPVYLETSKDANVQFYEGLGFTVVGEIIVPRGPHIRLMERVRPAPSPG